MDSSASLQVGREVQGESMGAIPEVQVVGHLVDLEVGHLVDLEVGHLVDLEVGHLVDPEVGRLVDPEVDHPEGQVVDSSHSRPFSHLDALTKGSAENARSPLYTVGPRYIKCPCIWLGQDISSALFYASAQIISTTLCYALAEIN